MRKYVVIVREGENEVCRQVLYVGGLVLQPVANERLYELVKAPVADIPDLPKA